MSDYSDFDRYCDEHGIGPGEYPAAFAAWLHERTGWDGPMERLDDRQHDCLDPRSACRQPSPGSAS